MVRSIDLANPEIVRSEAGASDFLLFPFFFLIALIGLVIAQPAASDWISEAVRAEFSGGNLTREDAPVQLAQPTMQIRTVRAY